MPGYVIIDGEYFTDETVVIYRGEELSSNPNLEDPASPGDPADITTLTEDDEDTFTVLDENTILVYLGAFVGDP